MDKDDIAQIRALPLETVLHVLGAHRDPKDPAHNWRLGASRITVTDSRFYDHNAAGALHRMNGGKAGGGGAIDLVQYLKDVSFREAMRELSTLKTAPVVTPTRPKPSTLPSSVPRPAPAPAQDRMERARWYLTEVRKIPNALVDEVLNSGQVFADARGNVVFRLRNEAGGEVGYEVRGTYERPFHSVYGEKGLFITKADRTRTVAFVESGIEALSYRALRGQGLIVSTTGSAVEKPAAIGWQLKDRGYSVVMAFNADRSGDQLSERLQNLLGMPTTRDRPPAAQGKDWNDQLRQSRVATSVPETREARPPR